MFWQTFDINLLNVQIWGFSWGNNKQLCLIRFRWLGCNCEWWWVSADMSLNCLSAQSVGMLAWEEYKVSCGEAWNQSKHLAYCIYCVCVETCSTGIEWLLNNWVNGDMLLMFVVTTFHCSDPSWVVTISHIYCMCNGIFSRAVKFNIQFKSLSFFKISFTTFMLAKAAFIW